MEDVETETHRDHEIWRMSRPRLKNLEDVETETHRDSSKGVETESLATHCLAGMPGGQGISIKGQLPK